LLERPQIDFGTVLAAQDGANITLFAKVLDDLAEHLVQQCVSTLSSHFLLFAF